MEETQPGDTDRILRLEQGLVELARKHQALLGRMGPKTPQLDEIILELEAKEEVTK